MDKTGARRGLSEACQAGASAQLPPSVSYKASLSKSFITAVMSLVKTSETI